MYMKKTMVDYKKFLTTGHIKNGFPKMQINDYLFKNSNLRLEKNPFDKIDTLLFYLPVVYFFVMFFTNNFDSQIRHLFCIGLEYLPPEGFSHNKSTL